MKKQPAERVIYSNYDLDEMYDDARAFLEETAEEEPTEAEIWNEIYFLSASYWDDEHEQLKKHLTGPLLLMGSVGLWTGKHAAGDVFNDFDEAFSAATQECDYWKLWDENGHLYLKCSHHDGTNLFEIKRLTSRGSALLDNWNYNYDDPRPEETIHSIIFSSNLFSALPHFAHIVYGCKKREVK